MFLQQSSGCCPSWPVEVAYKCYPVMYFLGIIRICLFLMEIQNRNKLSKYVFTCYFCSLSFQAFSLCFQSVFQCLNDVEKAHMT